MNARQQCTLASLRHVQVFLKTYEEQLPRVALLRRELDATVSKVEALATSQASAKRLRGAPGIALNQLRERLRVGYLLPIRRRALLLLRGTPELRETLRVPHANDRDHEKLLATADRLFNLVRAHRPQFAKHGLSATFVKEGRAAAKALEKGIGDPFPDIHRHDTATEALKRELSHGRALVAAIDSEVVARFRRESTILDEWRRAKRIPKRIGRPPRRARWGADARAATSS